MKRRGPGFEQKYFKRIFKNVKSIDMEDWIARMGKVEGKKRGRVITGWLYRWPVVWVDNDGKAECVQEREWGNWSADIYDMILSK